jgi:putative copper export protein
MSLLNLLMILAYWVFLSGVVFAAGAFVSRALVTIPSGADLCVPGGRKRCLGESAALAVLTVSVITLGANIVHLVLHASVVTETPVEEVFSVLSVFVKKTKFGRLAFIRTVFLLGLVLSAFYSYRKNNVQAAAAGVASSALVLITLSMSGHQGVKGYVTVPFFLDVLHSLAVALWIGGLFYIRQGYSVILRQSGGEFWDIFVSLMKRFSSAATWGVLVVVVTGGVLAVYNIKGLSSLVSTSYGISLVIKVSLACLILVLGGINKFFVIPMLDAAGKAGPGRLASLQRTLYALVSAEMYLGLLVLLLTSFLTHLSPEG